MGRDGCMLYCMFLVAYNSIFPIFGCAVSQVICCGACFVRQVSPFSDAFPCEWLVMIMMMMVTVLVCGNCSGLSSFLLSFFCECEDE